MRFKIFRGVATFGLLAVAAGAYANNDEDIKTCIKYPTDVQAAIDACTRLIDEPPLFDSTRDGWFMARGRHKVKAGDLKGALSDFDEAIRLSAKNPTLYRLRAETYQQLGDIRAAERDFARSRRFDAEKAAGGP